MSISHHELPNMDESIPTAIIYAKNDLFAFTVEMRHQGNSYFLSERNHKPSIFASMEQAKRAARDAGAKKAYAAYDTIYDEAGFDHTQQTSHRFDYEPIALETYY